MTNKFKFNKILYVEDDKDIRYLCKIALEDIGGFEVTFCENGQQAIETAKNFSPDLLLLDVIMPEMSGPMTLAKLRELPNTRSVPVIFMTAKLESEELLQHRELGVIDVITKPFDPMTIADRIKMDLITYHAQSKGN